MMKIEFSLLFSSHSLTMRCHSFIPGAWGCFDEFNRIDLSVLSVISSQLQTIRSGLLANQEKFMVRFYFIFLFFLLKPTLNHCLLSRKRKLDLNIVLRLLLMSTLRYISRSFISSINLHATFVPLNSSLKKLIADLNEIYNPKHQVTSKFINRFITCLTHFHLSPSSLNEIQQGKEMEIRMEIYGWHFTDNLPILSLPLYPHTSLSLSI